MVRKGTIMNQNAQSVSITAPALIYSQETKIIDVVYVNWQNYRKTMQKLMMKTEENVLKMKGFGLRKYLFSFHALNFNYKILSVCSCFQSFACSINTTY
jgi:hypothetical protein